MEALALIEFSSIGRGTRVVDDIAKKAPVLVHTAEPVSSGKYLLIFRGDIASVEESFLAGVAAGGSAVLNKLFLAQVHPGVLACLDGRQTGTPVDALGIVEFGSMATAVAAADAAAKMADVTLVELRLGKGIGGKGFFTLTGSQTSVEAAVAAASEVGRKDDCLVDAEIIPRPAPELVDNLTGGAAPGKRRA